MKISDATSLKMGTTDIVKVYAGQDVVWESGLEPNADDCNGNFQNPDVMDAFSFNNPPFRYKSCLDTAQFQQKNPPEMEYVEDTRKNDGSVCLRLYLSSTFRFSNKSPDQNATEAWSYWFRKGSNLWNFSWAWPNPSIYMSVFWEGIEGGDPNSRRLAVRTWAQNTTPTMDDWLSEEVTSPTTYNPAFGAVADQWNYFAVIGNGRDPNLTFLVAPPSGSGADVRTITVANIVDPDTPNPIMVFAGINGSYPAMMGWTPTTDTYLADFCWYNQLDGPI